jgi:hypothetical protein
MEWAVFGQSLGDLLEGWLPFRITSVIWLANR